MILLCVDIEQLLARIDAPTRHGRTGMTVVGTQHHGEIVFLSASGTTEHPPSLPLHGPAKPMQDALAGESGVGLRTDYRGVEVVAAWHPVKGTGWGLVVKVDAAEAFATHDQVFRTHLWTAALAWLVALLVAAAVDRTITRPLRSVTETAVRIREGERVRAPEGQTGEVGELTRRFNEMADTLTETNQVLEAHLQALDRVAIVSETDTHGRITRVNDNFTRISGYSADELLGQDHRIINSGHHPREFFAELWDTIAGGDVWKGQTCNRSRDGARYWVDTAIAPVMGENGEPTGYLAVRFDVTARREGEGGVRTLNEELRRRIGDLDALNQELESFSYSVSHDLRAPLHSIDGFSAILLEDHAEALDDDGLDCLARIRRAAQRMGKLIDDLLTLSRVTRRELRDDAVDLSDIARQIADELDASDGRSVRWHIDDRLMAQGDAALLRIVLENLLGNAWKFTGNATDAVIRFGRVRGDDGQSAFCVRDNGAGFDMRYANKLFTAFGRLHTQDEFPGTGVGLATVQRIVHRHGGRVWAEGESGKGAAFFFTMDGETQKSE